MGKGQYKINQDWDNSRLLGSKKTTIFGLFDGESTQCGLLNSRLRDSYAQLFSSLQNLAMDWFRRAADQGHPHSSYNLAIGHLNGLKTDLGPGEAHKLIEHAANEGVKMAKDVLENVCKHGRCE